MLILSPGSIRGCGNAKVVKAVVVMVTGCTERGPVQSPSWGAGDCSVLTSAGQGRAGFCDSAWESGDLMNLKNQFIQNYLLVSLGE